MSIGPYERLANAVVIQAVKDWRKASRRLRRNKRNIIAEDTRDECERFFLSEYFNVFTELDGKVLLEKLQREVRA